MRIPSGETTKIATIAGRDARDEEGHLLARVAAGEYRDEEPGRRAATDPHRQSSIT
jgi:hypothetical protein